jgi:hypothetical protein
MAQSKWPLLIGGGGGLVLFGGKAVDWFSSSQAESTARSRVNVLFSNLQTNGDPTIAVAMWLTA